MLVRSIFTKLFRLKQQKRKKQQACLLHYYVNFLNLNNAVRLNSIYIAEFCGTKKVKATQLGSYKPISLENLGPLV